MCAFWSKAVTTVALRNVRFGPWLTFGFAPHMSAFDPKRTFLLSGIKRTLLLRSRSGRALSRPTDTSLSSNQLTSAGLDRGRKRFGFILFAEGQNLGGILLQAIIIENAAVRGRIVITARPILHKLLCVWTESKPLAACDVIHVQIDLCRARQRECT